MTSKSHPRDHDAVAATRHGDGLSQWGVLTEVLLKVAPRSKLSWSLFLLVFAGNVVVAVLAWVIVGLIMR
jgi:hypothetical protein